MPHSFSYEGFDFRYMRKTVALSVTVVLSIALL